MCAQKTVSVAVIGAGVVGGAFLDQIIAMKSEIQYNVVLIAEAAGCLISRDYTGIQFNDWRKQLAEPNEKQLSIPEIIDFLKSSPYPPILVDNTSSAYIADF